jgi:hypothetical protein
MSESLNEINQDILNSIRESKNRLRKLSEDIKTTSSQSINHNISHWNQLILKALEHQKE